MENVIKTQRAQNYSFDLYKRRDVVRFSSCPYAVIYKKDTPKGKYSKFKIIEHIVFDSIEKAEAYINRLIDKIEQRAKERNEAKEAIKQANKACKASDFFQIGDIVYNSWGYEQTNIDFYVVTKITDKKINIVSIGSSMVENSLYSHGMACEVVPNINEINENKSYFLTVKAGGRITNPERFYHFCKYDGRPKYESWYA